MNWWNDYVGIPYTSRGRERDGLDCWGLVRLVYREQFGAELPSFDGYQDGQDPAVVELIARERESWRQKNDPEVGDVVLFRVAGREAHVGIYIGEGKFLHAREGHAACIERLESGAWKHRVVGFWSYEQKAGDLSLVGCPHPLRTDRLEVQFPAGSTITDVVTWVRKQAPVEIKAELVLMLDGKLIPAELWDKTITLPGQRIEYRAVTRGSSVGRALLTIAVLVAAVVIAPYLAPTIVGAIGVSTAVATSLATAAISFAGQLLINAIFPVRPPKQNNPGQAEQQNILQGGNNQANQYGAIPVVLGRFRFTPPLGAVSYAEASASASYLRMLLCWGYGPLQISDMRIGATPIETLEEVQYETLTGFDDDSEDLTNFNRIYGKDVSQQYFGTELVCIERNVSSASRTSNVVTVTTTENHTYTSGQDVDVYLSAGGILTGTISVTGSKTFTFPSVGPDGSISASVARMQPWIEHTINDESDSIGVSLHFPEGLRRMPVEGDSAGRVDPTAFRCKIQVRQLDPLSLAPLTSWGDIESTYPGGVVNLQPAWFNTDSNQELEPVYRWTRLSLDEHSKLVVRTGAFTTNPEENPTGAVLLRQQEAAFGVGATYNRLPDYGLSEEPLWDICVYGNTVFSTVDRRDANITGAAITLAGLKATVASATVVRADSETVMYGLEGQSYYKRKDAFTTNISFAVAKGVYQVRARRTNNSLKDFEYSGGNKGVRYHQCQLLFITGYENRRPVVRPPGANLAMSAIRVRATNQLNGNIDGISATVQSICKDWDHTTSAWVTRPTRNPASLFRYVLQHPANAQRAADANIDLDSLVAWHDYCRTNSFMFDSVLADQQSILDVLRDIAAAGRASPTLRDGKWAVVIDSPRTSIAQHFTPHNSWGFEGARALPKLPHAFRVQFNNAERGYQPDEMIVYNDGYSSANATLFEALQLPGVTTKTAVFKHARFHLAQLKLRPETYTLNADIEHLICQRGDLVRVTHDVPMWGIGTGRIKTFVSSTTLELDEKVPMDAGVQYTIRIRLDDGSSITRTVAAVPTDGYYSTITLTSSVTATQGAPGNLFMFGSLSSESVELIVQSIEPSENMTARMTLADYSPDVYNSDEEVIPAFDSQITLPARLLQATITQKPNLSGIVSDISVMVRVAPGEYQYAIKASFTNPSTLPQQASSVQAEIDFAGDSTISWGGSQVVPVSEGAVTFTDVQEGESYRIRIRYVDDAGRAGPWSVSPTHTVQGHPAPEITDISSTETLVVAAGAVVPRVTLSWTTSTYVDWTDLEWRHRGGDWQGPFRVNATSYDILLPDDGLLEARLTPRRHIDGPQASYSIAVNKKTQPPANVQGLAVSSSAGGSTILTWEAATDLDVLVGGSFWLRYTPRTSGVAWGNASDLAILPGNTTNTTVPSLTGTYLAKWIDSGSRPSQSAAIVTTTLADLLTNNVVLGGQHEPTWPGTKTEFSVVSGMLQLTAAAVSQGLVATYRTQVYDMGQVYNARITALAEFTVFSPSDLIDNRTTLCDAWQDVDNSTLEDVSLSIYYRTTRDNITFTDWSVLLVSSDVNARAVQFELRARSDQQDRSVSVNSFEVTVDVPDRIDSESDVISGTSTKAITFARPFFQTPAVAVAAQGMAAGDYYSISAKSTSGFSVTFRDSSGTIISRTFDWVARGY